MDKYSIILRILTCAGIGLVAFGFVSYAVAEFFKNRGQK